MSLDAATFCYPARQIAAVYDEHICTAGEPDVETEYLAREREHGTPSSGYRPALYVPGKNRRIVIIDKCFGMEGHARAWIADQIRLIAVRRKFEKETARCAN
ncbi:hypothetical protein [Salinicola rhizosphaerae]|uniref:Uncharacterized protein n=1 Tax=Salinicola rhizosphaerae TaxID=1443141 RepID=A0ABQ3E9F3_9GAMM|nr:hypothetical protein [Salinicola rhizosphaerae]GHB30753.1 hypothetical protein GCM10009038_31950 [Salinicola rhizosphaerae]